MAGKQQNGGDEGPQISPEERARIAKSARQVAAYANFLRWTANFRRDEVVKHPNHDRVMLLSPMQSGRFSFAIEGDTLLLGVQDFEAAWMAAMPFDCAYVSDRLYLSVEGVACMDAKLPPLALGILWTIRLSGQPCPPLGSCSPHEFMSATAGSRKLAGPSALGSL
ncbi:hypothetical protein [Aeromonas veronii]|uniref:hypothetical protein n=1 Tax=Aeromonas veronii TaxID=654 RepID=UPI001F0B0C9F|nr:hypothetical protein [Aeromonas veronii]